MGLTGKVTFKERFEGHEELSLRMSGGGFFQAEGTSRQMHQGRSMSVCPS